MLAINETLGIIQRTNPDSGALELLLGVQTRGQWQNWLNFPGGKVEAGETPHRAVAREVSEETGLEIGEWRWLGEIIISDFRPGKEKSGTVAVFGANVDGTTPVRSNPSEIYCQCVDPTDRNILLNMPADVKYWLPLAFGNAASFICHKVIEPTGGESYTTLFTEGNQLHALPAGEFSFNL